MKRINKLILTFLLLFIVVGTNVFPVHATNSKASIEWIEISSKEDFLKIAANPNGNYRLTRDLNLSGIEWKPFSFTGHLDGNNHSILNLTIKESGDETTITYDGNMKAYDTYFAGIFSILDHATVENLNLCNIRVDVNEDRNCFVGSMCGYSEDSTIKNCSISGQLCLHANAQIFGVGGAVGYGNGKINSCNIYTTLIAVDTNVEERNEQFMGGAFGGGYMDVDNCSIHIKGFDSNHGYVHNGGVAGIYLFYPEGKDYSGSISHNTIKGIITFFEDNRENAQWRCADCNPIIGKDTTSGKGYLANANTGDEETFTRDERFEYDKELLPEMCDNPEYEEEIVAPTEVAFGYTTYTCKECHYSYNDNYTLLHEDIDNQEATSEQNSSASTEAHQEQEPPVRTHNNQPRMYIVVGGLLALIILFSILLAVVKKKQKN